MQRIFPGWKFSRRNFIDESTGGMPELPDQDHGRIVFDRNDCGCPRMADGFKVNRHPIR